MSDSLSQSSREDLLAEIIRLKKIITALMNRAERSMNPHRSDFGLFETSVLLETEINRRTAQFEKALRENAKINRTLKRAQKRMKAEISERKRVEGALKTANKNLELLSTTDPLTGLANRRRFMERLTSEWKRALRSKTAIGLAMMDIDNFKKYNDRYGHPAGDVCLCTVAATLVRAVRETDLIARYGGEEFAAIFPDTNYETACRVAKRALAAVRTLKIPHADNPPGIVTISMGVTAIPPLSSISIEHFINIADTALYAAKNQGRNTVWGSHSNQD